VPDKRTFLISRAGAEKHWAELIAGVVRDVGHEAIYQDQDFVEGTSFPQNMMLAAESDCTIAVLSPAYFESEHCLAELHAALASDPIGVHRRILPVRVVASELPRLVAHLAAVDLVGCDEDLARKRLMVALVRHGKLDVSKLAFRSQTRRAIERANRNRSAMIEKVRAIWITGFLQRSQLNGARILLGLSERPDAVARPLDLLVKRPDEGERPLPPGTQILEVFDQMNKSLLILGAPGSGKTTLLLELVRNLLDRADRDAAHPIPVVFPLSTWGRSRKPLKTWMEDELRSRYYVPLEVAHEWVAADQILPLLDGLDEVKVASRAGCILAINDFRQSHGLLPLVVTARTAECEAEGSLLQLHGAIVMHSLTRDQVLSYLATAGRSGEVVTRSLRDDPSFWDLLDTPLMLNVFTMAFSSRFNAALSEHDSGRSRDRILEAYVDEVLRRHDVQPQYSRPTIVGWLTWLARQLVQHDQTVFYIERMQPDWLTARQRALLAPLVGAASGLGLAMLTFSLYGPFVGPVRGLISAVLVGFGGALVAPTIEGAFKPQINGARSEEIICQEPQRWSFRKSLMSIRGRRRIRMFFALLLGLGVGLIAGLVAGLARGPAFGIPWGIAFASAFFVIGLVFQGLLLIIQEGLYYRDVSPESRPNQGIRTTLGNSFLLAFLFMVFIGGPAAVVASAFLWYMDLASATPRVCAALLLASSLLGWLLHGGSAVIKHFAVRVLLAFYGNVPFRLASWLEFSCQRMLLKRVGSGYAFIHRLLLDHLASVGDYSKIRNRLDGAASATAKANQ
jgi:hypothetical protein